MLGEDLPDVPLDGGLLAPRLRRDVASGLSLDERCRHMALRRREAKLRTQRLRVQLEALCRVDHEHQRADSSPPRCVRPIRPHGAHVHLEPRHRTLPGHRHRPACARPARIRHRAFHQPLQRLVLARKHRAQASILVAESVTLAQNRQRPVVHLAEACAGRYDVLAPPAALTLPTLPATHVREGAGGIGGGWPLGTETGARTGNDMLRPVAPAVRTGACSRHRRHPPSVPRCSRRRRNVERQQSPTARRDRTWDSIQMAPPGRSGYAGYGGRVP